MADGGIDGRFVRQPGTQWTELCGYVAAHMQVLSEKVTIMMEKAMCRPADAPTGAL